MKRIILVFLLMIVTAQIIQAMKKTITITETNTVASPVHVEGTTYRASDGTEITLEKGQDPTNPKYYKVDGEDHGLPTSTVTTTYTITIEIPDNLNQAEITNMVESEFRKELKDSHKPNEFTEAKLLGVVEVPVTKKFLDIIPYESTKKYAITGSVHTTTVITQKKEIQQSNSVQIGDPVLMTSGQYRYDETDMTISAGNAVLELGRHYQSGEITGDSIGRKWFHSLDTRIILGTCEPSEQTYIEMLNAIQHLENDLQEFSSRVTATITQYTTGISNINNEITMTETALNDLKTSNYASYSEVRNYINDLTNKIRIQNEVYDELVSGKENFSNTMNSYITEYERQLRDAKQQAAELKIIANLSSYNRSRNTLVTKGFGFDGYTEIGTKVIIIYDTYGRKSMYEVTTEPTIPTNSDISENGALTPYPTGAETKNLSGGTDVLNIRGDGCYELTKKNGTIWLYGNDGLLRSITDRNSNIIAIEYENDKAAHILRNGVKVARVEWQNGKISAIVNARDNNDRVEYVYSNGILSGMTDSDGDTISFGYTEDGLLNTIMKPDSSMVRIDYDLVRDGKKLANRTSNEEQAWEIFSYSQNGKKVEHTTHSGVRTIYEYDDDQRLTKEISADGTVKEYVYDNDGNITKETINGITTSYTLDKDGNKERADYSDGSWEAWTYDRYGSITSYRDRDGILYDYIRNTKGNLTAIKADGKTHTSYDYDQKGKITSVKSYRADGTSSEQKFLYDNYGNITEQTTGNAPDTPRKEEWAYDNRNRPVSYSINGKIEETYVYDGKKTTVTNRNGLVAEYVTDCRKDCVSITETDTKTGEIRYTSIEYDKRHMPIKRTLSTGKGKQPIMTAEYRYLPGGEPEAELISDGKTCIVTTYGYKNKDNQNIGYVTGIRRMKCTCEDIAASRSAEAGTAGVQGFHGTDLEKLWRTTNDKYSISYEYEITQDGTKIITTAPDGTQTTTEYDAWSRLKSITDAMGITTVTEYSPAGRIKKQQSQYGGFTEYKYDKAGNLENTKRADTIIQTMTVHPDGTPCRITDSNGRTTEYIYDSLRNLVKVTVPAGSRYMTYDEKGRLVISVIGGNGSIQKAEEYTFYSYGTDGRIATISNGGLYTSTYTMNAWGETVNVTDGEGNSQTLCYDSTGRISSETDAYGNTTFYEYDVMGFVTKATYPDGTYYEYKYDVFGNTTERLFCGKTIWKGQYDSSGRLTKQEGELTPPSSYQYDSAGRITAILSNGETSASYTYTDRGRTVSATDGKGNTSVYKYDSFGNIITEGDKIGKTKTYIYDDGNELSSIKQFSGKNIAYRTSADGLTHTTTYDDGSSDIITYTLSGRIKSIQNATGEIHYEYDKGGMLVKQTDGTSEGTITYSYDKAGRKTHISGAGRKIEISYGKNGEVTQIRDYATNTGFKLEYDTMLREIRRTSDNGVRKETSYNRNGTVDRIIIKDRRGIVLSAESYVYDDDGRKIAFINSNGDVTLYEYDVQGRLSTVFYPDTPEIRARESKIVAEYGITDIRHDATESKYISKKIYEKIAELQNLCHNINAMVPTYRNFRVEKFSYDKNGNRMTWQIGGGLLEYSYDKNDRLIECRTNGKKVRSYIYDSDGNLEKETIPSEPGMGNIYEYGGNNRMAKSVTYRNGGTRETLYSYDALGRRISTGSREEGFVRSTYDSFGFETLSEVRSGTTGAPDKNTMIPVPQGERYRFITDGMDGSAGSERTAQKDDKKVTQTTDFKTRTTLYVGGSPAAVCTDGQRMYLSGDDIGSVSLVTDDSSSLFAMISYDAFGTPAADTSYSSSDDEMIVTVISRAAYAGKPYDMATGLYDYGFRDYSPSLARFTTVDPARDGLNWYAYCANDPVNFVDAWGLDIGQRTTNYLMGDSEWANELTGNGIDFVAKKGKSGQLRNTGCAITEMSNVISSATGKTLTPKDINDDKSYFATGTDNLYMQKLAEDNGLSFSSFHKANLGNLGNKITELKDSENQYFISAQVKYKEDDEKSHWIGISDIETREDGKIYAKIEPTSTYDTLKSQRPRDSWSLDDNGDMWIETSDINKIYTYQKKKGK